MILTTAITWAILATGMGIAAAFGWLRTIGAVQPLVEKCDRYSSVANSFAELFDKAQAELTGTKAESAVWQIRAQAAESSLAEQDAIYRAHMKAIGIKGNQSPKRRRQA